MRFAHALAALVLLIAPSASIAAPPDPADLPGVQLPGEGPGPHVCTHVLRLLTGDVLPCMSVYDAVDHVIRCLFPPGHDCTPSPP